MGTRGNTIAITLGALLVVVLAAILIAFDPQSWRLGGLAVVNFGVAIWAFASFGRSITRRPRPSVDWPAR